jgi:LysM repeat protein
MFEQVRAQWKYVVAAVILVVVAVSGLAAGVAVLAQGPGDEAPRQPVAAPASATGQQENADSAQGAAVAPNSPASAGASQGEPTPRPPMGATYHTVQSGETLGTIAATYGLTSAAIANANGLANPNLIRVGQRLIIPAR